VPERISRKRALAEGWLTLRDVREALGIGHATAIERFKNASRDGLRVARLETGEWRLHPGDLEKIPRRYEERGAPRSRIEALARDLEALRDEVRALRAAIARR
jgi:hypothetical protein